MLRLISTMLVALLAIGSTAAEWRQPLCLDGGGWWRARIRVTIANKSSRRAEGEAVAVKIGRAAGEADLVGQSAEAVRACDEQGAELLFAIQGPEGGSVTRGRIPAGSSLILPAECDAGKSAACYVYFDNPDAWEVPDFLSLECTQGGHVTAVAERPERLSVAEVGGDSPWYDDASESGSKPAKEPWDHRAAVRAFNFTPRAIPRTLFAFDATMFDARTRGGAAGRLLVTDSNRAVVHGRLGNLILLDGDLAALTVRTWQVYWCGDPAAMHAAQRTPRTAAGTATFEFRSNLVKNPGFEGGADGAGRKGTGTFFGLGASTQGDEQTGRKMSQSPVASHAGLPADWTHDPVPPGSGIRFGLDHPGRPSLGSRCAKMVVPHAAGAAWRGWHQSVPVQPGRTYLLAAWVKCEDVRGGDVQVHAHRHRADGQLSKYEPMTGVGPAIQGTADWTLMSGLVPMPEDTVSLELHLTMNATGTVWHDGVVVAEVTPARVGRVEGRPLPESDSVEVWPVPAVIKVFQDDPPRHSLGPIRISAARNEQEPLQLAVRSGRAIQGVRVEIDPPTGPQGRKLDEVEVNVVGYVPIDWPTNYYQTQGPRWRRKVPASPVPATGSRAIGPIHCCRAESSTWRQTKPFPCGSP